MLETPTTAKNAAAKSNAVKEIKEKKDAKRRSRLKLANKLFKAVCVTSAVLVCLILLMILFLMFREGVLTFKDVSPKEFFFSTVWEPEKGHFGAFIFIYGTFALTALTLLISVPISIFIAIFLVELAPKALKNALRPIIDLLVGIPSVVYGYLGFTLLIPVIRNVTGSSVGDGLLAASLVLAIMILPTVTRLSDDAISAVPQKYIQASYALGGTRFQTITKVTLPAARGGIMYAVILGMARAIGETFAVVLVIGNTPQLADSLVKPTAVLTSNIVNQIQSVESDSTWSHALYLMGFILLAISLLLIASIRIFQRKGAQ